MSPVTVLVAVAGDDEARIEEYAETVDAIAGANAPAAHIVHVYAREDADKIEQMYDVDSRDSRQLGAAAEHNTAVSDLMQQLRDRSIEFTTHGAIGDVGTEVVELGQQLDVDFVLIGGQKRSPAGKALFGSTAQDILLNSTRPVIFCGTED